MGSLKQTMEVALFLSGCDGCGGGGGGSGGGRGGNEWFAEGCRRKSGGDSC